MSIIGEGVDLIKAAKEWKEEYDKKHDADLYIHRITDLNNKLCHENEKLKEKILELENGKLVLNDVHYKVLKLILDNCADDYVFYESAIKRSIENNIDEKIAYQELIDNDFIEPPMIVVSGLESKHYLNKITEVLKFIKKMST